jgi:hypothetical protein
MAKAVDLKAAKEAKQKKIVIGGAVLLVLILGVTMPRTLKMINHKAPTSTAASQPATQTTPTATSAAPAPTSPVPTSPAPVATPGTPVSQVLSAPLDAPAQNGQLARLSPTFKSKDPFVQQLNVDGTAGPPQSAATTTTQAKATTKAHAATHTSSKPTARAKTPAQHPSVQHASVPATTRPTPNPTSPSNAPTTPAAPAAVPYLSAILSIDGVPEGVNVKSDFPAASPIFHLVSATKKTAVITIAGGSLANGAPTLTLRVGKAVTLMNTADGTRYKLVLVSTSTAAAVPPTQAPTGASGSGATAPATATQTTTGG